MQIMRGATLFVRLHSNHQEPQWYLCSTAYDEESEMTTLKMCKSCPP